VVSESGAMMHDGFRFVAERVTAVAQAFGSKQDTPKRLAGPLDRVGTVQTGDTGLVATTRDIVSQITTLLGQYSDCLRAEALDLELTVIAYTTADEDVADAMGEYHDDIVPTDAPPATGVPVAERDYGPQLNPRA
jgi:hypothetical protein